MMALSEDDWADEPTYLFSVLANPHRRHALAVLMEADSPLTLTELAEAIERREQKGSNSPTEAGQTEQIRIALYHTHIPKLEKLGLVKYDLAQRSVALKDT